MTPASRLGDGVDRVVNEIDFSPVALREKQGFKVDMSVMDYNLGVWCSGERFKLKASPAFRIKLKPWIRVRFPGKGSLPDLMICLWHSTENNPQTLAFVVRGFC